MGAGGIHRQHAAALGLLALAGCTPSPDGSLRKYIDILSEADMQGISLFNVTETVCPIFDAQDFSARSADAGAFRLIEGAEFNTWVITQSIGISATKLLSINIEKKTGACSAYVKQRSTF